MEKILTCAQMRAADKYTMETLGVPSETLMERAGRAVLSFRYSNAQDRAGAVTARVEVNGAAHTLSVPYTRYEELFTLSQMNVTLKEGRNVITFSGTSDLLLDCLIITYL